MSDKVTAKSVVTFHFSLLGDDGEILETSVGGDPVMVLQGHGNVVRGLDRALLDRAVGERFTVSVSPEDAYGHRRDDWTQRISKKYFTKPARLKAGQQTVFETKDGHRRVTIVKVGAKMVDVDLNHPLAGKTLNFEIEVLGVREAEKTELAHGHAHQPGGHHH